MSGLSLLRMTRPVMRSLAGTQQLHSQMVVRMMSSQKELQYIKVDTAGDANTITYFDKIGPFKVTKGLSCCVIPINTSSCI